MIRLIKLDQPQILVEKSVEWTASFARNNKLRDYAHIDIRNQLGEETRLKCAYCEGRIDQIAWPHVEHILPKSRRPELVCSWDNLTLACQRCNSNKNNYYDLSCPLVNPYIDDPAEHLQWAGPMVMYRTPDKGRVTVARLKLNESGLLYQRAQKLERVREIIDQIGTSPPNIGAALEQDLTALVSGDAEYSAAVSAFAAAYQPVQW